MAASIMDVYHASLAAKASMDEWIIIFTVALVLVILISLIPNLAARIIPSDSSAASSGSSFDADAIVGAGATAADRATGGEQWLQKQQWAVRRVSLP